MTRLLIALVLGILLGTGATFIAARVLSGAANGTYTNASLYQYGNR